jgi:hypothetical protein
MWNRQFKVIAGDLNGIAHAPLLLIAFLSPVLITLFLLYLFPLFSLIPDSGNGFLPGRYYPVTSLTLISAIPFIYGLIFSHIHLNQYQSGDHPGNSLNSGGSREMLYYRFIYSALFCFVVVLPVIFLTDAVSTEGWLRTIYASALLAALVPFIFAFILAARLQGRIRPSMAFLAAAFIVAVPSGVLLHHPWNYLAFFSPFYWVSWAWIISSPGESLLYGSISVLLISGSVIFSLYFLRRH